MNPSGPPSIVRLIDWRRHHTLFQVIDAIRTVASTRLLVACDGPSPEHLGEAEKLADSRAFTSIPMAS